MTTPKELRRFRRMALEAPARITVNGIDNYAGRLVNISPGDLTVRLDDGLAVTDNGDAIITIGDAAVVAVAELDLFEGRIARLLPDGFALSFRLSRGRRAQLTENLMLRANPALSDGLADRRRTPRHRPGDHRTVCRLATGGSLFVRVVDHSVDGVAVESARKPPVGAEIHIGRMRGTIIRHTPRGFVVMYDSIDANANADPARRLRAV